MANLIPPHAHKILRHEYRARVTAVWLFLIAAAVFVVALLFLPVYVLIENQTRVYAGQYVEAEGQSDQFASITNTITHSNMVADALLASERPITISEYLVVVLEAAGAGIVIDQFMVAGTEPIIIGGKASTRTELAAFKSALEATEHFERVELPISALADERDIKFTMQLIIKADTR